MSTRPIRQQPPAVDPDHLRETLRAALELAAKEAGGLEHAIGELRRALLEAEGLLFTKPTTREPRAGA